MDVTLILKVVGVGILVAVSSQILAKSGKDEQAMLVTVAGVIVVMLMLVSRMGELIDTVRALFDI
jgi:stage III sporulation protein AC